MEETYLLQGERRVSSNTAAGMEASPPFPFLPLAREFRVLPSTYYPIEPLITLREVLTHFTD